MGGQSFGSRAKMRFEKLTGGLVQYWLDEIPVRHFWLVSCSLSMSGLSNTFLTLFLSFL